MRINEIENIIKSFNRPIKFDNKQINSTIAYIYLLKKYICENYENVSSATIKRKIQEDLIKTNIEYCKKGTVSADYLKIIAFERIMKDREFTEKICKSLVNCSEPPKESLHYTLDEEKNCINIIKNLYLDIRKMMLESSNYPTTGLDNKKINEGVTKIFLENMSDILHAEKSNIKTRTINSLLFTGEILEKYGLLEKYVELQKQNLEKNGCGDLALPYSTGEYKRSGIGIKEFFSKDFLETIDFDTLVIMDLFYKNRLAKELSSIGEAILIMDELDLWGEIKNEKFIVDASMINGIKNKMTCIQKILVSYLKDININNSIIDDKESNDYYYCVCSEQDLDKIVKQKSLIYEDVFYDIIPYQKNDLRTDLSNCLPIVNVVENVYKVRGGLLSSIVYYLIKNKSSKNFGIIKEDVKNGELVNIINASKVLIGIDYEGLNMPIRLHMQKKDLIDILRALQRNSIIQEYEGDQDFVVDGEIIPTNVLFPTFKEYGEKVNKIYKNSAGRKNERFISHLRFLKDKGDSKFPRHLMKKIVTSRGIKYERKPKKYIDLYTGTEYYLSETKRYVKITDEDKGEK